MKHPPATTAVGASVQIEWGRYTPVHQPGSPMIVDTHTGELYSLILNDGKPHWHRTCGPVMKETK